MGYFEARDDQCDSLGSESFLLGFADGMSGFKESAAHTSIDICPLVDLGSRDDEGMAGCYRVDGHEDDEVVVAVHECSR